MNLKILCITAASATTLAVAAPPVQAADTPLTPELKAQRAAEKGPTELRRFLHRTRMIYNLRFNDFYRP
jgi:hypothetical protein